MASRSAAHRRGPGSTASTTGQEEAAARFGADPRHFSIQTKRFVGDERDSVKAIDTVGTEWVSENGRFVAREVAGTEKTWPATLVLLALGFLGPEHGGILDQLGVTLDASRPLRGESA